MFDSQTVEEMDLVIDPLELSSCVDGAYSTHELSYPVGSVRSFVLCLAFEINSGYYPAAGAFHGALPIGVESLTFIGGDTWLVGLSGRP